MEVYINVVVEIFPKKGKHEIKSNEKEASMPRYKQTDKQTTEKSFLKVEGPESSKVLW